MHIYEVIKRPIVTEKSNTLADLLGQYTFEVDRRANKHLVKQAVEQIFDVQVQGVRVVNIKPKRGRYGRRQVVREPAWKKAIVTLAPGQKLEMFEGV
ncbi:MAG: 50S ribosomal protein L23 [Chloroflexota bacterium]